MRKTPYTERGIKRVPCVKCGAPSAHQWRICSTDAWSAVCSDHDFEINKLVAEWAFGKAAAAPLLRRYQRQFKPDVPDVPDVKAKSEPPSYVLSAQAAWERRKAIKKALDAGATQKAVAKMMGLSVARVSQLVSRERRDGEPPVRKYLRDRVPTREQAQ